MFAETLKKEWYIVLLLLLPFAVSAYLWDEMPDTVPTHFNIYGEVDDWGPKWVNAFMFPAIGLFTYLLLIFLPLIDPKKRIESRQKPIAAIRILLSIFMVGMYVFIMATSLGKQLAVDSYIKAGVGALIMVLGNYMNSVKQNYFIGVKTPWTLENEEVWKLTHRLTSKIWTVGGLLMVIQPFAIPHPQIGIAIYISIITVLVIVPVVYSYVIFQKLQKKNA
jgi:uncharacterized membrane protein